jgi:hypothetical protein
MSAADNNEFGVTNVLNALWSFSYPAHELKIKGKRETSIAEVQKKKKKNHRDRRR